MAASCFQVEDWMLLHGLWAPHSWPVCPVVSLLPALSTNSLCALSTLAPSVSRPPHLSSHFRFLCFVAKVTPTHPSEISPALSLQTSSPEPWPGHTALLKTLTASCDSSLWHLSQLQLCTYLCDWLLFIYWTLSSVRSGTIRVFCSAPYCQYLAQCSINRCWKNKSFLVQSFTQNRNSLKMLGRTKITSGHYSNCQVCLFFIKMIKFKYQYWLNQSCL